MKTLDAPVLSLSQPALKQTFFPIVAIGASAGGLDAVKQLLKYLDPGIGMIFFYVQHLSPTHPSSLTEILSNGTKMKVHEAKNGLRIEPGNVYVCTPNKEMIIADGAIKLIARNAEHMPYLPIDDFFCSLAKKYKEHVIGIVLSGNAGDGTAGAKAIKDAGGMVLAQDTSAKYGSMPESAISSGVVDFVLSPKKMAAELARINKRGYVQPTVKQDAPESLLKDNDPELKSVLDILYKTCGIDFSHYKMQTIKRRLLHRMQQHDVSTLKQYLKLLSVEKSEAALLYKDLLINVTSFFRDKEAFACLKAKYVPQLLKKKKPNEALRVWVPACATGEEVYSLAILISELQSNSARKIPVQIFATDISERVLAIARKGVYTESELKGSMSPARMKKFFVKEGVYYRIAKELRDMCVFSMHNILSDPPFSRMDLISCRNLLIYFDTAAQKRTVISLHFALSDAGYLMLGKAETVGVPLLFTPVSNAHKIFSRKKEKGIRKVPELVPRFLGAPNNNIANNLPARLSKDGGAKGADHSRLNNAIDAILISGYMPACAVINKDMEILQFRGNTALYLAHPQGKASLNILKMTKPECALELRSAINKAIKIKQPVSRQGIEMLFNSRALFVSLNVHPLDVEWDEPLLLVVFTADEEKNKAKAGNGIVSNVNDIRVKRLSEELNVLRGEMHNIIESQEKAYEELQIANEEIVSSNEEFQTLNEELETTKEEIEASNEELTTTNQELRMRNDMLVESNNFSEAVINTLHEPLLILNTAFYVKSANNAFYKIFNTHRESTEGMSVFALGNGQWDIKELRVLLDKILVKSTSIINHKISHTFNGIGEKTMLLNANRIEQKSHGEDLILLAIADISELTGKQELEKQVLLKHISNSKEQNELLEAAVKKRTKQIEKNRKILEEKNAELMQANHDLTSFTYVSSHDLQEPLRKIQVFSSLILKSEQTLSDKGKAYFQKIQGTSKRMQKLLQDLLSYSQTKNIERVYVKSSLNTVIDKVVADFDEVLKEKNAVVEYNRLCEIDMLPFQFGILISNLLSNALKFASAERPPHIKIKSRVILGNQAKTEKLSPKKKYCCLTVQDNGIGFDNQYKERIFDVFQRLHTNDDYEGTGIGLAICKRVVENHNGIITATGSVDRGARLDIYIPVSN